MFCLSCYGTETGIFLVLLSFIVYNAPVAVDAPSKLADLSRVDHYQATYLSVQLGRGIENASQGPESVGSAVHPQHFGDTCPTPPLTRRSPTWPPYAMRPPPYSSTADTNIGMRNCDEDRTTVEEYTVMPQPCFYQHYARTAQAGFIGSGYCHRKEQEPRRHRADPGVRQARGCGHTKE